MKTMHQQSVIIFSIDAKTNFDQMVAFLQLVGCILGLLYAGWLCWLAVANNITQEDRGSNTY
jgi:hypothetical protein